MLWHLICEIDSFERVSNYKEGRNFCYIVINAGSVRFLTVQTIIQILDVLIVKNIVRLICQ